MESVTDPNPNPGPASWQVKARKYALPIVWLSGVCLLGMWFGSQTSASSMNIILTGAFAAALPAVIQLLLAPLMREEWAQAIVMISWTAMAGIGMAMAGNLYTPLLALSVLPIVAAISFTNFTRVLEASFLASLVVIAIAIAGPAGLLPRNTEWILQYPGLETAALVLCMIGAGAGMISVLPAMDQQARITNALVRHGPHLDFCINDEGQIITSSDQARTWSKGAKRLDILFADDTAKTTIRQAIERVLGQGEKFETNLRLSEPDKRLKVHVRAIDKRRVILSVEDITGQQNKFEALVKERDAALQASKDKTVFLASMSHELRTPLNAIIGFSDMIKARLYGPIPAKYAEYADLIHESGQHLVDLVGDVLDMSKIESEKYELRKDQFDLPSVIRSCIKLMQMGAEEAGVSLVTQMPDMELPVNADRKAMRQILFNLLSNAIKFTPGGGTITTSVEIGQDNLILQIKDNGVGMSEEDVSKIGQPFQQAESARNSEARGTGLGLSLVKALTELHAGQFALQSELGQGTSVQLVLPILDEKRMNRANVQQMDVRAHIRRAQQATEEISSVASRLAQSKTA